jgi:nucleoid-associated protein YgaU
MDTYTEAKQGMRASNGQYAKLGMGALGLVALAALFVVMRPRPVDNTITPMPVAGNQLIEAAVKSAGADEGVTTAADKDFVEAQRKQLSDKKDAEALTAKLDQLARDPKALEQHNRDVANKVQLVAKAGESSAQNSVRSDIEAALSDAAAADTSGKEGFVAAIQPEVATRQAEMRTVVVVAGDTLSIIAQRAYGDTQQFRRIFDANPRVLTSPNHIYPGQVLRIPAI